MASGAAGRAVLALGLVAALAAAAPLQPHGSSALGKIYPRGSHWAVGHLMGKKSSGDPPDAYEDEEKTLFPSLPETPRQPRDPEAWRELSRFLLRLLEGNGRRDTNAWETDNSSSWKDMMDELLRAGEAKESAPS